MLILIAMITVINKFIAVYCHLLLLFHSISIISVHLLSEKGAEAPLL